MEILKRIKRALRQKKEREIELLLMFNDSTCNIEDIEHIVKRMHNMAKSYPELSIRIELSDLIN